MHTAVTALTTLAAGLPTGDTPLDSMVLKIVAVLVVVGAIPVAFVALKIYGGADKGDVKKDMNRTGSVLLGTVVMAIALGLMGFVLFAFGFFKYIGIQA